MLNLKNKINVFHLLFLIIIINFCSFFLIYLTIYKNSIQSEIITNESRKINYVRSILSEFETIISYLNAPGNDIFESNNVVFEKKIFNDYQMQFDQKLIILKETILKSFNTSQNKEIIKKIENLNKFYNILSSTTLDVFSDFKKNNFSKAAKKMAIMDRNYALLRSSLSEIRDEIRSIDDSYDHEQFLLVHEQHKNIIFILLVNIFFNVALFIVGIVASKKSKKDNNLLAFYKKALDVSASVAITNKHGNIVYANEKFSELSGYEKDELIGKNHRILNSKYHPKEFFTNLWETINSGNVWHGEIRNKRKDNKIYWVNSTIIPMLNEDGEIEKFVAIRFDISKRKEAEALKDEKQKELDQFFSLSRDFLCISYINGKFKKVSNSYAQVFGYSTEEVLLSSFLDLVHPDDLLVTKEESEKLLQGNSIVSFVIRCRTKLGNYIHVSWTATPADGIFYAIGRDITEAIEINKKLEEATKSKANFLATMSHEIRTPLNGILGMSTLLEEEKLSIEGRRNLNIMKNSGDSLLSLINDILDFSKIEANKLILEEVPFCLQDTINELISLLYFKAKEKNIIVHIEIDSNLPKYILADITRFRQVFTNLYGNAIKFTKEGSITIKVTGKELSKEKYLFQIDVQDTGIGIPIHVIGNLFKSFSQVDASTTRKYGGTGLGLAICKGICEAMGGKIWVESEINKGSTFSFTFCATIIDKQSIYNLESKNSYDTSFAQKYPLKILVADDHSTNQILARKYLEKLGYSPDIVASGIEVINAVNLKSYDVIFMDGHMPEMDGFEATKKIHSLFGKEKSPWIIALTASATTDDRQKCFDYGMNDFVSKPFTINSLVNALLKYCEKNKLQVTKELSVEVEKVKNNADTINRGAILKHFDGDEDILELIIQNFLKTLPDSIKKIENAILLKDAKGLQISAHTLKGNISNFFMKELYSLLFDLETYGKNDQFIFANEKFDEVKSHLNILQLNLESLLLERKNL